MVTLRLLIGLLLLAAVPADAAPVADPEAWANAFTQLALANNPDAMLAKVNEIAYPGFNTAALRGIFEKIDAIVGTGPGNFAEQFDEKNVGTFLKRINVAIHYPKRYMFYSITFRNDGLGWQMVQFDYNTNINDVLTSKWPE